MENEETPNFQEMWDKIVVFNRTYVKNWEFQNPLIIVQGMRERLNNIENLIRETVFDKKAIPQHLFVKENVLLFIYLVTLLELSQNSSAVFKKVLDSALRLKSGALEKNKKPNEKTFNPKDYYNMRFGLGYVDDHVEHYRHAEWVLEKFNPTSLLDVGCAKGYLIRNLKKLKPEMFCVGLDISEVALKHKVFSEDAVVGCGWALPFRDHSFELLHSGGVLEHFPPENIDDAINEFSRVAWKNLHYIAMNEGTENIMSENREHVTVAKRNWWIDKIGENRNWIIGAAEDRDDNDLGFNKLGFVQGNEKITWTRVNWEGNEFDQYFKN